MGMSGIKKPIQWNAFLIGLLIAEIVPIAILIALVALFGPSEEQAAADYAAHLSRMVGPIGGTMMGFIVAARIGRKSSAPVQQGLLLGVGLAILDAALLLIANAQFEWLLVFSNVLKILGSGTGGALAAANNRYEGQTTS
jgi:hypothetical protein